MSGLRGDLLSNYLYSPISFTILLFQEFARWPAADVMNFSLTHTERQWNTHTHTGSLPVFMLFLSFDLFHTLLPDPDLDPSEVPH